VTLGSTQGRGPPEPERSNATAVLDRKRSNRHVSTRPEGASRLIANSEPSSIRSVKVVAAHQVEVDLDMVVSLYDTMRLVALFGGMGAASAIASDQGGSVFQRAFFGVSAYPGNESP
jgi:hypothetical protein